MHAVGLTYFVRVSLSQQKITEQNDIITNLKQVLTDFHRRNDEMLDACVESKWRLLLACF